MTGFIVAVALVMPNKKLSEVTVERIMDKFKEKSFAKGVNREIIKKCEELLGIKVEELAEICLKAMQEISDQLGL
jgi:predicted hydrolase (HD superfamily)